MKEKIEEILLRNNNWKADEDEVEIFGVEFSRETMDKVINELSTLIQQEREEAVRGFAEYLDNEVNPHLTEKKIGFESYIGEYLSQREKGEEVLANESN